MYVGKWKILIKFVIGQLLKGKYLDICDWSVVKKKILMIFVIGLLLKWQGVSVLVPLRCWIDQGIF